MDTPDLTGMVSADGEVVPFAKTVKINVTKGVEGWLKEIRDNMAETVKRRIREAHNDQKNDFYKDQATRQEWALNHCGQAIAVVSMLNWTNLVEESILEIEEDPFAMRTIQSMASENLL